MDFRAGGLFVPPGDQRKLRDRCDAGKRLSPKAQSADRKEVIFIGDLAGGVSLDAEQGVVFFHAEAVVGDPDQGFSAPFHFDPDAPALGIDGVFQQLLDHRRRPFHHLAGGDFIR